MTALDKYIRLEALGEWRENQNEKPREVIVSFGDASLQLTSLQDTPITHWALLATQRIGTNGNAVIYSTDADGDEYLAIEDPEMNRAIFAVTRSISPAEQPKNRFKNIIKLVAVLLVLAIINKSMPIIYPWAATLTAPQRLVELSDDINEQILSQDGLGCRDSRARQALTGFATALFPNDAPEIVVTLTQSPIGFVLPNRKVILSISQITGSISAEQLAANIALEYAMFQRQALLIYLFKQAGPFATLRHITGKNIAVPAPISFPEPIAADFVVARDQLQSLGIDPSPLQKMAAGFGFGLPLTQSKSNPPFAPENFAILQQFCQQ